MKSEKHLHKMFGDILQKQMDEDMEQLIQAEQRTKAKLQPAYMHEDLWQEKKRESQRKQQILNRKG